MPATEHRIALPERYRVVRHIASGGMASVWAAEDELLGRLVAVKVLSRALDADERARTRFMREARAAARLGDCRHVVTVYDIGEHEGRAFIVMEHFAGGTVADRLRRAAPVPRPTAVRWLRETATALDCAHDNHVVHRDVKPANLLLDDQDRLAVGDFGIATVASEASVTLTGQVLGTAAYISPEQARGEAATAASDRYALAVVAYELLTGERPFQAGHPAAQARAHVEATVPDASAAAHGLPSGVDDVLRDGMAKAPEDRPATAGELIDRLERALGDTAPPAPDPTEQTRRLEPVAAAPVRPREAQPSRHAQPPRTPPPGRQDPQRPGDGRSRRIPLLVALCGLALVAGAVAAVALSGGGGGGATGDRTAASDRERSGTAERSTDRERTTSTSGSGTSSAGQSQSQSESTPAQTSTGSTATQAAPATGDPKSLNDQGFALIQQENPTGAVPLLQGSVQGFREQGRTGEIDYAFALFNLGNALRLSGRPGEAVPLLEERLEVSDYKRGVVRRELALAREQAGMPPASGGGKAKDESGGGD